MARNDKAGKAPSQRMLRVGEVIRHALAEMLSRGIIQDDVLAKQIITVPQVRMSPDLMLATCYIMPLGGQNIGEVLKALDRHKKFIRGDISQKINMKFAPELRFREDDSFSEGSRIEALLRSPAVQRDVKSAEDHTLPPDDDEN